MAALCICYCLFTTVACVYTHYWWMVILLTHPTNVSHHSTFLAIDTIFPESLCFCLRLRASPSCLMLVSFVWFLFMPYNLLCLLFYFWTLDILPQFLHIVSNSLTCDVPLVACAFLKTDCETPITGLHSISKVKCLTGIFATYFVQYMSSATYKNTIWTR